MYLAIFAPPWYDKQRMYRKGVLMEYTTHSPETKPSAQNTQKLLPGRRGRVLGRPRFARARPRSPQCAARPRLPRPRDQPDVCDRQRIRPARRAWRILTCTASSTAKRCSDQGLTNTWTAAASCSSSGAKNAADILPKLIKPYIFRTGNSKMTGRSCLGRCRIEHPCIGILGGFRLGRADRG